MSSLIHQDVEPPPSKPASAAFKQPRPRTNTRQAEAVEGVVVGSKSEWETAFSGNASGVTAEETPEETQQERWKQRGLSRKGGIRLSSGEGDKQALPSKFDAARKLLKELLGTTIKVDGDGLCWLYAFLASTRALQDAKNLTQRDYQVVRYVLNLLFNYVRDGGCDSWLATKDKKAFLGTVLPPYKGALASNYSGADVGYRVLASYMSISIIILDAPAMNSNELRSDGDLRRAGE